MSVNRGVTLLKTGWPTDILRNRKYAKYREAALFEVGKAWFNDQLPKHFEDGAETAYNYQKRSPRWLKFKRKKANRTPGKYQNKPLTFTGYTKRLATSRGTIVADGNKVTIRYKVPDYVGQSGKSKFVSDEIKKTNAHDIKVLEQLFMRTFNQRLEADNTKVKVRI